MTSFRVVFYKDFTVFLNSCTGVKIGSFGADILPNWMPSPAKETLDIAAENKLLLLAGQLKQPDLIKLYP